MKNNDEFRIYTNEYDDDARAVKESELLPIYETMAFSGDIQPLEDISVPEYEKTDLTKNNDNKNTKKKTGLIKSASDIFNYKAVRKLVAVLLVIVIMASVVTGAVFAFNRASLNESPIKAVYKLESDFEILLENGKTYGFSNAEEVKVSDNGMMVYLSKSNSAKTGKYDLLAINVGKKSSLKKGGSFVDSGVDEGWITNSNGSFLSYSKTKNGIKECYLYSAEAGKSVLIANNVEEVFLPPTGDIVYFTRRIGSVYSLHKTRFDEEPVNVASQINYVNFCNSDKGFEILYTSQTGNGLNVDVFLVTDDKEPITVCKDVSEVYANKYTYKGNLYFFKKNTSTVNWQDFVNDVYFDSDAAMQRPLEGDYMIEVGFIFKRYVLDTAAYNAAMNRYKAKQKRDLIRDELNKIDLGLSVKDSYSAYVYNGMTTKKLASGILLDGIYTFSTEGSPRMVYAKSVIDVENKITMDKLVSLTKGNDVTQAVDFVTDSLKGSYELSDECMYTWYDGTRIIEYPIKGYEGSKTKFILGDNKSLLALVEGNLTSHGITTESIGEAVEIDSEVADCSWCEGCLYYTKAGAVNSYDLFSYSAGEGKKSLDTNLCTYIICDKDCVFLLKYMEGADLMNIRMYSNGTYTEVDSSVNLNSFKYNGRNIAYLKNVGADQVHNAGEMYIYTPDSGTEKCKDAVTQIIYIN